MNKAELDSKSLSDLHKLAADAGVERYRMLSRGELIEKLQSGGSSQGSQRSQGSRDSQGSQRTPRSGSSEQRDRPPRRRRSRGGRKPAADGRGGGREPRGESRPRPESASKPAQQPPAAEPATPAPAPAAAAPDPSSRPRRRRRRFGRRGKQGVTLQSLLLPPAAGRQAIVAAETREACTALLRGVAADLSRDSNGPDPVALLIDPSPEELAEWRRDAPKAEIVAAGQPRHASDALAQATARASGGDDVLLLVDSLTRLGEAYEDAEAAKQFFDAGRVQAGAGSGTLTVVAALERPASS